MTHTVKGFGIVNKAEIDVFLELSCFFDDTADVVVKHTLLLKKKFIAKEPQYQRSTKKVFPICFSSTSNNKEDYYNEAPGNGIWLSFLLL